MPFMMVSVEMSSENRQGLMENTSIPSKPTNPSYFFNGNLLLHTEHGYCHSEYVNDLRFLLGGVVLRSLS